MDREFYKKLNQCVRCGRCRSICPAFAQTLLETDVARGRLFAIRELDRMPSSLYLDALSRCLLCGACETRCKGEVPVTDLVRQARSHHKVSSMKKFAARQLLPRRDRMEKAGRFASGMSKLFSRQVPEESGLRLRTIPKQLMGDRRLPEFPEKDFLSTYKQHDNPDTGTALFIGCVFNYLLPDVAKQSIAVLQDAGIFPAVPKDQACCGLMAYGAGDDKGARLAAENFVRIYNRYETIITLCASCTVMLKKHLPQVMPDAVSLAERVVDVHELLLAKGYTPKGGEDVAPSVGYHAPCHLRFGTPSDAPFQMLQKVRGVKLVDIGEQCCGYGGSFTLSHPKLSAQINRKRMGMIEKQSPTVIATSCSGCMLGLYDGVKNLSTLPEVLHPLQILFQANLK